MLLSVIIEYYIDLMSYVVNKCGFVCMLGFQWN